MSQLGQSHKKIVTKSKYVEMQFLRVGMEFAGICLLIMAAVCEMLPVFLVLGIVGRIGLGLLFNGILFDGISDLPYMLFGGIVALLAIAGTRKMNKIGYASLNRAEQMQDIVPLTRKTASHLPAPDSLVRASEEPDVVPKTILLRPLIENPTTPPEQLVRSCGTPE